MTALINKTQMETAAQAIGVDHSFLTDIRDLFEGRRSGHVGHWQYSDSLFPGDAVRGAALWEAFIRSTKDYYVLFNEIALIRENGAAIAHGLGPFSKVIEFGPGSREAMTNKTIPLLTQIRLAPNAVYVPFDISDEFAKGASNTIVQAMPWLDTQTITGDYLEDPLPTIDRPGNTLGVFINNLPNIASSDTGGIPADKVKTLLRRFSGMLGANSHLLVTYDSNQDERSIFAAYDHPLQRAFGSNLMHRIVRDLPVTRGFDPTAWRYEPIWKPENHQVCHTVFCEKAQAFRLGDNSYSIEKGQSFVLNNSFKYPSGLVEKLAKQAGFETINVVKDRQDRIAMHMLRFDG